ncbi:unnamed protein product [Moneuplotes crassus]|uniref:Uncharacterized protein n=1 Tax=Euplotes crassus TaxID=5936 RepID=A0AAD1XXA0_EUPCR|nr:unnamed protein product [Moneuplotes crassus]
MECFHSKRHRIEAPPCQKHKPERRRSTEKDRFSDNRRREVCTLKLCYCWKSSFPREERYPCKQASRVPRALCTQRRSLASCIKITNLNNI